MKIISWNVNGIRAVERKGELDNLLEIYDPDILLLQEIKGKAEQFSKDLNHHDVYDQWYNSAEKPGYSGTGVWVKKSFLGNEGTRKQEVTFSTSFPENPNKNEGRVSRLDFDYEGKRYAVVGVYFPNGGKSKEAWNQKLVFYEKFLHYVNNIRSDGIECIWGGDVNCAHNEIDLERDKENQNSIGFLPEERAWLDEVVREKWVDVFRHRNPETVVYSWWDTITRARSRNVGWRIDYFFVDQTFESTVKNIEYLNDQMGSDHCPVLLEI